MSILDRHEDKWTPEPNTGCFIWHGKADSRAYGLLSIDKKIKYVSRMVCEEVYGPPPTSNHWALHDVPNGCVGSMCVNPKHLRWGTVKDNTQDISSEKRSERVRKANAGFTPEERSEIKRKANAALTAEERSEIKRRAWVTRRRNSRV